jgi:hypothetical protein
MAANAADENLGNGYFNSVSAPNREEMERTESFCAAV